MKKVIVILSIVTLLFGGLVFLNKKTEEVDDSINPYGDKKLSRTTIEGLKSGEYENQLTYEDFERVIFDEKESAMVYVFSPECIYCTQFNPTVNEVVEESGVNFYRLNVLEYPEGFKDLNVEGTPSTIYFENGEEKDRISGMAEKEELEEFVENNNN